MEDKPKIYSWAGHCRFKVIDSDCEDDEYDQSDVSEESDIEEGSYSYSYSNSNVDELSSDFYQKMEIGNQLKQSKPQYNKEPAMINRLPKQAPKPLKSVSVYLRNDAILAKTRVKNPKHVHLYSHPLHKISKASTKTLKRIKSLKLLSLRDYGYRILEPVEYDDKDVDFEEAKNGELTGEEILYNELDYLLSTTVGLRKFYVMLCCNSLAVFKRLQTYARRQKGLKEFGFILDTNIRYPLKYKKQAQKIFQCDLSPLRPTLQKLEIRLENPTHIEIRGLPNLHRVTKFVCGTVCGRFPCDVDDYGEEIAKLAAEVNCLGSSHIDLIDEMLFVPNLKSVLITNFEMGFEQNFWETLLSIFDGRADVRLAYQGLANSGSSGRGRQIRNDIRNVLSEYNGRTIDFMVLADDLFMETCLHGGGLRTEKFNFDKQYLHEIKGYEIFKRLKGDEESEGGSYGDSESDIYNDIAYIGYQVGYH